LASASYRSSTARSRPARFGWASFIAGPQALEM
jgi:hypothetical protein